MNLQKNPFMWTAKFCSYSPKTANVETHGNAYTITLTSEL